MCVVYVRGSDGEGMGIYVGHREVVTEADLK